MTYTPLTAAADTSTVTIAFFDGVGSATSTVNLEGNGVAAGNLVISEADTFDFGTYVINDVHEHTFTITNDGDFATTLMSEISLSAPYRYKDGGSGNIYPGDGGNCGTNLAGGINDSCTIVVEFAPVTTGTHLNLSLIHI